MCCMNMWFFTYSYTFIWVEWGSGVKGMRQPFIWHQLMSNICASLPPTLIMNGWAGACLSSALLSPLWSSGKHLLIRDMWSLSKVQNLHRALDHGDGSRCRLSLLCDHADFVFYSHLSRLRLEDFGIYLFSSEMMQSFHSLIFYLICVKKGQKRYLHGESIEASVLNLHLSSWYALSVRSSVDAHNFCVSCKIHWRRPLACKCLTYSIVQQVCLYGFCCT